MYLLVPGNAEERMARILLIEDDIGIHKVLSYNLKLAGTTWSPPTWREGLELARVGPDLVLLE